MKNSRLLLIMLTFMAIMLFYVHFNMKIADEEHNLEILATIYSQRFQNNIISVVNATETLESAIVLNEGEVSLEEVEELFTLLFDNGNFLALSYLPDGIVEYAYPVEGNENSIGHNVLEDDITKAEAIQAMETGRTIYSGPYTLIQGVEGIVVRNPVYVDEDGDGEEEFWGFVAVVVDPKGEIMHLTGVTDLQGLGYEYMIESFYDRERVVLTKSENYTTNSYTVELPFKVGHVDWYFSIYRTETMVTALMETMAITGIYACGAAIIYIIALKLEKKKEAK